MPASSVVLIAIAEVNDVNLPFDVYTKEFEVFGLVANHKGTCEDENSDDVNVEYVDGMIAEEVLIDLAPSAASPNGRSASIPTEAR